VAGRGTPPTDGSLPLSPPDWQHYQQVDVKELARVERGVPGAHVGEILWVGERKVNPKSSSLE